MYLYQFETVFPLSLSEMHEGTQDLLSVLCQQNGVCD